jgi:cation diffusion facilitator family transporter
VYAALAGNLCIAATKFAAAALTGSSVMLSEGVHSLADTGNEALLLYGMRRAARPPDDRHPLGHGRELYFWSFIVALVLFSVGAGVAMYEGVTHLLHPTPTERPIVAYVVIALSAVFEGTSWWVAVHEFRTDMGDRGYLEAMQRSKDPPRFIVLFEDTAALIGLAIAAVGTFASSQLGRPEIDGIASIMIGLLLGVTATMLAVESKGLLLGERADEKLTQALRALAERSPAIRHVDDVLTVHLAPDQVFAAMRVQFAPELRAADIERAVAALVAETCAALPDVITLYVTPCAAAPLCADDDAVGQSPLRTAT